MYFREEGSLFRIVNGGSLYVAVESPEKRQSLFRVRFVLTSLSSGAVHPFPESAFLRETLFQRFDLPVEQIIGLVDQRDHGVAEDFRSASGTLKIGLIGPIRPIFQFCQTADCQYSLIVLF